MATNSVFSLSLRYDHASSMKPGLIRGQTYLSPYFPDGNANIFAQMVGLENRLPRRDGRRDFDFFTGVHTIFLMEKTLNGTIGEMPVK